MDSKPPTETDEMVAEWAKLLIGQPEVIEAVIPHIRVFQAELNPEGRPAGIFLLIGPTGTGKTHAAESLAKLLHGSSKHYLRVNCAEFQHESDVNKLQGCPPGFIGHRETPAYFNQRRLEDVTSENCGLSIILLDEIEKACSAVERIFLGILDKGILRLGDNSTVSFEKTIILMSSNVGAREMSESISRRFGYSGASEKTKNQLGSIASAAVKRRFSPEFLNRIDTIVPYHSLSREDYKLILANQLKAQNSLIIARLALRAFTLAIEPAGIEWLLDNGISKEYGARELKRILNKNFFHPVAEKAAKREIPALSTVVFDANEDGPVLSILYREEIEEAA